MTENRQLQVEQRRDVSLSGNVFNGLEQFRTAQRMANALMSSNMVPDTFKNDMGSCLIALDMASRLNMNVLAVMQNMYVVHGKPAWSSQFIISAINQSGLFASSLNFEFVGEKGKDSYGCKAWVIDKQTKKKLEGTTITIEMAKAEGWYGKAGSKWKTMPEQMLRYRAAAFFGRVYAPDLTMGILSREEVEENPEEYTVVQDDKDFEESKANEANKKNLDIEAEFEEIKDEPEEIKKDNVDTETGEILEDENIEGQSDFFDDDFVPVDKAPF